MSVRLCTTRTQRAFVCSTSKERRHWSVPKYVTPDHEAVFDWTVPNSEPHASSTAASDIQDIGNIQLYVSEKLGSLAQPWLDLMKYAALSCKCGPVCMTIAEVIFEVLCNGVKIRQDFMYNKA